MQRVGWLSSVVWVAACGSAEAPIEVDAAVVAPADAAVDASLRGEASIVVRAALDGAPIVGAHVLFLEADGTLAADEVTDAAGHAAAEVGPGATVVQLYAEGKSQGAIYYLGVNPGDELRFGNYNTSTSSAVNVAFPTQAGADSYAVQLACADGGGASTNAAASPVALTPSGCAAGVATDIIVRAYDGGTLLGSTALAAAPFAPSLVVPGPYAAPAATSWTISGLSPAVTSVQANTFAAVGRAEVQVANASGAPVGGAFTLTSTAADTLPGGRFRTAATVFRPEGSLSVYANDADDVALTAGDLVPQISGPVVDYARGEVVWSELGGGSSDAVFMLTEAPSATGYFIYAFGPTGGATTLALPALPAPYSDYSLQSDTPTPAAATMVLFKLGALVDTERLDPIGLYFKLIYGRLAAGAAADVVVSLSSTQTAG